jgi:hypothetical protein
MLRVSRFSTFGQVRKGQPGRQSPDVEVVCHTVSVNVSALHATAGKSQRSGCRSFVRHHDLAEPITFSWTPGYDFELTIWDAPDTGRTHGGITVLLKSRYPGDTRPALRGEATRGRKR